VSNTETLRRREGKERERAGTMYRAPTEEETGMGSGAEGGPSRVRRGWARTIKD
jgi:hypothetical protein